MDLNKLKVFKCVADVGQINLASNHLKIASSAISVSISSLESDIECKLFIRHYKGVTLTPQGRKLYQLSKKILWDVDHFINDLKEEKDFLGGNVTIATTQGISSANWFNRKLSQLTEVYPDIRMKIINYKNNDSDCSHADLFLCPFIYDRPELVQNKINDVCFRLFASKYYVEKFGTPQKNNDLDNHRLISFSRELKNPFNNADSLLNVGRKSDNPRSIFLEVDNSIGLLKLVKMGVGIGSLHVNDVSDYDLIQVLNEEVIVSTYLTHHKKDSSNKKINIVSRVFLS